METQLLNKNDKHKIFTSSHSNLLHDYKSSPIKDIHQKHERIFSASPQNYHHNNSGSMKQSNSNNGHNNQNDAFLQSVEAKEYLPLLKRMPQKISDVELQIYELNDLLRRQYVSYSQLQIVNGTFKSDIDQLLENTSSQTLRKVISIIEDKVPFDYLQDLMKNKASFESFKQQEREIVQLSADLERLINRFGLIELDHRHYSSALEGLTKEDVETMLKYKEDKIESDKKISELQTLIKSLNVQFEIDQRNKDDFFKRIEKSIHEIDENSYHQKSEKQHLEELEIKMNEMRQRMNVNEYRMADFTKKMDEVQQNLEEKINEQQASKLNEFTEQLGNKLQSFDDRIKNQQSQLQNEIMRLINQLTNSVEEINRETLNQFMSKIDAINKRMTRNEVICSEIQSDSEQLKFLKQRQIDELQEKFNSLQSHVNSKLILKVNQLEKDVVAGFGEIVGRLGSLESEFEQIKGPLLDEFKFIKNESIGLLRELERQQGNYRELVADYMKTLDSKLQEIVTKPAKFFTNMETTDELVRASTIIKLNQTGGGFNYKGNNEGVLSSQNIIASMINQQMLNTNSLLSIGSSDLSHYLKSNKLLQSHHMKKALRNIEKQQQLSSSLALEFQRSANYNQPTSIEANPEPKQIHFQSPISHRTKHELQQFSNSNKNKNVNRSVIEEFNNQHHFYQKQNQNNIPSSNVSQNISTAQISPHSLSNMTLQQKIQQEEENRVKLKIRTKSGGYRAATAGTKRRNYSSTITNSYLPPQRDNSKLNESDYQLFNQVNGQVQQQINSGVISTLSNKPSESTRGNQQSTLMATPIGGDYSTLLSNVAQLKKRGQQYQQQNKNSLRNQNKSSSQQQTNLKRKKDGTRTTLNSSLDITSERQHNNQITQANQKESQILGRVGLTTVLQARQNNLNNSMIVKDEIISNDNIQSSTSGFVTQLKEQIRQSKRTLEDPTINAQTNHQQNRHTKNSSSLNYSVDNNKQLSSQKVMEKSTFFPSDQKNNQQQDQQIQAIQVVESQTVTSQMFEFEEKRKHNQKKIMLEKQLPLTLHRFQHLMKDQQ